MIVLRLWRNLPALIGLPLALLITYNAIISMYKARSNLHSPRRVTTRFYYYFRRLAAACYHGLPPLRP
jgi:hypothetical protein